MKYAFKLNNIYTLFSIVITGIIFSGVWMNMVLQGLDLAVTATVYAPLTIPRNFSMSAMTVWTDFRNRAGDCHE